MKRLGLTTTLALFAAIGITAYHKLLAIAAAPEIVQAAVTRGDITESAISTGTLSATRTVDVGTEVSGLVRKLDVDFNSIVHKGEVIAELDTSQFEQALASAEAARDGAQIDLEKEQAAYDMDEHNLTRADSLHDRGLDTDQEREQAQLQVESDEALLKQDKAAVTIADANIEQAKVDLAHCTVRSPIDGVVISRNVDEGQTVVARMSAPTLYVLATDITKLEIVADVDESDVSRIHAGQHVSFTVDAYPGQTFGGTVEIVRLNATNTNNVVTYQVVSSVPNPDLRLMPGMTATINVEIWRASGVVRVPTTALRFRPSDDDFAALGQAVPPEARVRPGTTAVAASAKTTPAAAKSHVATRPGETIDVFFKPLARPETAGQVWVMDAGHLKPMQVRLGITDGAWTEVTGSELQPGDEVVTNVVPPSMLHPVEAPGAGNPLIPSRGYPRFGR